MSLLFLHFINLRQFHARAHASCFSPLIMKMQQLISGGLHTAARRSTRTVTLEHQNRYSRKPKPLLSNITTVALEHQNRYSPQYCCCSTYRQRCPVKVPTLKTEQCYSNVTVVLQCQQWCYGFSSVVKSNGYRGVTHIPERPHENSRHGVT